MAFSSENPVAVVIDAETVCVADAAGAIAALAEKFPPLILHAFGDFRLPELQGWCELLDELGGQALQVTATEGHDNSVHICLTMNVMEILHANRASAVCIFCGSGDFSQLAVRVRKSGLPVFGFGTQESGETMAPWFDTWQSIDEEFSGGADIETLDEPTLGLAEVHGTEVVDAAHDDSGTETAVQQEDSDTAAVAAVVDSQPAANAVVDSMAGFRPIYSIPDEQTVKKEPAAFDQPECLKDADADAVNQPDEPLDDIAIMAAIEGKHCGKIARIKNPPPLSDENLNGRLTEDATLLLSNFITDNLGGNGYALLSDVARAATATSLLVPPEQKTHPDEYLKQLLAQDGRFEITTLPVGDVEPEFIRRV